MPFRYQAITSPVPANFKRKDWALEVPIDTKWNQRKKRILFVIDHVPTEDLKARKLLTDTTGNMFLNVVDHAHKIAKQWKHKTKRDEWAYAFVNFGYFKTYDLDADNQAEANRVCVQRLRKLLAKLKPTHIHFFGTSPAYQTFGFDVEKRGWVQSIDGYTVSSNISITNQSKIETDSDDDDDEDETEWGDASEMAVGHANMLGHASENLARLLIGKYPFSLKKQKLRVKKIESIKSFDKFFKRLRRSKVTAYDTETLNLTVHSNAILTMQFTLEDEQDVSYVIPIKHKDSPWNPKQLKYIYTKMREYFVRKFDYYRIGDTYLIGQNIAFDLRMTRQELAIPVIWWRVWDTMNAESRLDENCKGLPTKTADTVNSKKEERNRPFALDTIFSRYENDFYYTNSFGKSDRVNITSADLNDKGVLDYMGMDTVAAYAVHNMQLERARCMPHQDGNYYKPFKRLMLGVCSDTSHSMSHMQQNGMQVDVEYIATQFATDTSDIEKVKREFEEEIVKNKAVKRANKRLLAAEGINDNDEETSDSMFAGTKDYKPIWQFDIHTQTHQQLLFFEVMKLSPVQYTAKGNPSLGKAFLKFYGKEWADDERTVKNPNYNKVVAQFAGIMEAKKARSTFSTFYSKAASPDGQKDNRIRGGYGFAMIVTGRSNSFDPNMQNIPTHGKYAKIIKRAFVSAHNLINIKMDFSAHEVRMWSILANDKVLAKTFKIIWNMLLEMRQKKELTDEDRKLLKRFDTHRINFAMFNQMDVGDVTDDQRQESKGLTFGAMYGKAIRTMAKELGISFEDAQDIADRFFGAFFKGKEWLDWSVDHAAEHLYTYNLFGLRRNLPGYLTGDNRIMAAMGRQAQNSPIQGIASQLGYMGSRLLSLKLDETFEKHGLYGEPKWDKRRGIFTMERPAVNLIAMVHDSTEMETPYHLAPLVARAMEVCATTGLMDYATKLYGIDWPVRLVVDFELGDSADKFAKWDFTPVSWVNAIKYAHKNGNARGNPISAKMVKSAIKPANDVKAMMKRFPLDLSPYKIKDAA